MSGGSPYPFVSLRARMTLGFGIVMGLVVLLGCSGIIAWTRHRARHDAGERVEAAAGMMQRELREGQALDNIRAAFGEVGDDEQLADVSLMVVDATGHIVATNNRPAPPWPHRQADGWLVRTVHITIGTVVCGVDGQEIDKTLRQPALLLSAFGLLVTLTATLLTWFFVGRTLRPIGALSEQARYASHDPLHAQLVPPSTDAEVRLLVSTLNEMLERLREDTFAKEQFYMSAAHELRTPLTVLSASTEAMLVRPHSAEEYRETLVDLQQQTQRLIRLTESLLLLNRLEMRTDGEEWESVDLADICERALGTLQRGIAERGLVVHVDLGDVAPIEAPPTHVLILLRNLMENAVRYTPSGGSVMVTLDNREAPPRFQVYNDCLLPDDLDLNRLFLPFYRAEGSRSAATGGNGLGLAICKALADANGWGLTLKRERNGLMATVRFKEAA